jgi:hypothetical protein
MNQTLEKNMCNLPDAVANSDVSDLKERSEEYIDPALRYACVSWHMHLIGAHRLTGSSTHNYPYPTPVPGEEVFVLVGST